LRLLDLSPAFVRREVRIEKWNRVLGDPAVWKPGDPTEEVEGPREYHVNVDAIEDADGVRFLCPKCYLANAGARGTHSVLCWRPRVPAGVFPMPGRWEFVGTNLSDLSLVAGSSSVLLTAGCKAHFFVEKGEIRMC
jgi:hypothetical protein